MTSGPSDADTGGRDKAGRRRARGAGLGPALRRAWLGYQLRLDEALAATGFDDRGFPDGRVLRICAAHPAGTTISHIGRQLGITRQGAGKAVASLRDRRYVTVIPSETNGREKIVTLTTRAIDYLAAEREARRAIERQLRAELGPQAWAALHQLLEALGAEADLRVSDYLRTRVHAGGLRHLDDWLPASDSSSPDQTPPPRRQ